MGIYDSEENREAMKDMRQQSAEGVSYNERAKQHALSELDAEIVRRMELRLAQFARKTPRDD